MSEANTSGSSPAKSEREKECACGWLAASCPRDLLYVWYGGRSSAHTFTVLRAQATQQPANAYASKRRERNVTLPLQVRSAVAVQQISPVRLGGGCCWSR
eukprot:6204138-Pleurochrysis_carterae.AAC.1